MTLRKPAGERGGGQKKTISGLHAFRKKRETNPLTGQGKYKQKNVRGKEKIQRTAFTVRGKARRKKNRARTRHMMPTPCPGPARGDIKRKCEPSKEVRSRIREGG